MANDIQFNNPEDITRAMWNARKSEQQSYLSQLSGGSWSQPSWDGWKPIHGAGLSGGIVAGDEVFQRQFPRFRGGSWFPMSQRLLPEYELFGGGVNDFIQRYAQDGDSGFFHGMVGRGEPLGMSPFPPNHLPEDSIQPLDKPLATESNVAPVVVEPSALPNDEALITLSKSEQIAEPEQHALHLPPFSGTLRTGFGKDSALYEEPFEMPQYKGSLHKKKARFSK
jgi:hypothetical protein